LPEEFIVSLGIIKKCQKMENQIKELESNCCGANLLQYEDGWGICSDCKEWAEDMPEDSE